MWIFTKFGFFSVTEAPGQPGKMQMRARAKRHLEQLIDKYGKLIPQRGGVRIHESMDTDYRYRIYIGRGQWQALISALASSIDYSNFKNAVDKQANDPAYHNALHRVWAVMLGLQPYVKPDPDDYEPTDDEIAEAMEEAEDNEMVDEGQFDGSDQ